MNKNSFTIILTVVLMLLILFSSNTKALDIEARTNRNLYFPNQVIELYTTINIDDKLVPIEKINITIFNDDNYSSCEFELNNPTCEDDRFLLIEVFYPQKSYGYLYDSNNNWGYGYGYTSGIIEVKIKWLYNWPEGIYNVNVSAITGQDLLGRRPIYSTTLTFKGGQRFGNVAFICRTDSCDYGLEKSAINFLTENGWVVNAKGYWSWTEQELLNYKLIACADELKACKIDGSHPAFSAHKKGIPFLEIADQPYAQAAYRFGYARSYVGMTRSESMHITAADQITSGYSGSVNVITNAKFNVIPDYQLTSVVKDLADAGQHSSSTLFVADKYAYVGWFGASSTERLTADGNIILNRLLNWLIKN
ncbi:MAG: hypothetical protein QXM68_04285 [Candidatus Aenigmatarchaeota archaeon]|nr:hypothetical protein [Candidatus Aenigmarchaeota archaeon]